MCAAAMSNVVRGRPKSAKPATHTVSQSPSKGTVPCQNCGSLQIVAFKGGGYNMSPQKRHPAAGFKDATRQHGGDIKDGAAQEGYVSTLIQQIKLLELEIAYLKQHPQESSSKKKISIENKPEVTSPVRRSDIDEKPKSDLNQSAPNQNQHQQQQQLQVEIRNLREDLRDKSARLEAALSEKNQIARRLKSIEQRDVTDQSKKLDQIARLSSRLEQLEGEMKMAEERSVTVLSQLEQETISSRDREKQINQLQEELDSKEDRIRTLLQQMEGVKSEVAHKEKQFSELQDKFLQSSVHIMEETARGLKEENRRLQLSLREMDLAQDADRQLRVRLEQTTEKLLSENADLSATLSETRQKLESEVRVRENRDARLLLDTQELSVARERERELKQEIMRLQAEMERERNKVKNLNDKLQKENQLSTTLELRTASQKSRISEMESCLNTSHENAAKIKKQVLVYQEKIGSLTKEIELKENQCQELSVKLAGTENRLLDAERRVEALATLQSHRWMEFSKMADNMKELSHNMLAQSKSNTRKAAIRADLDEELDM